MPEGVRLISSCEISSAVEGATVENFALSLFAATAYLPAIPCGIDSCWVGELLDMVKGLLLSSVGPRLSGLHLWISTRALAVAIHPDEGVGIT